MARRRDYAAERAGRDRVAQALGYESYQARDQAQRAARQRGDFTKLRGAEAADPGPVIARGVNVAGLARAKVRKDPTTGARRVPGRRSVEAVARDAIAGGQSVEIRYTIAGRSGPVDVSTTYRPDDWPDDMDIVDIIELDAAEKYAGGSWAGAVTAFTVTAV